MLETPDLEWSDPAPSMWAESSQNSRVFEQLRLDEWVVLGCTALSGVILPSSHSRIVSMDDAGRKSFAFWESSGTGDLGGFLKHP